MEQTSTKHFTTSLQYTTLPHYSTLHYVPHHSTLHYLTTVHFTTSLQSTSLPPYSRLHYLTTVHYTTSLQYTTLPHYSPLHYLPTVHSTTSLQYTTPPHYSTLHYLTTVHYTASLPYTTLPYIQLAHIPYTQFVNTIKHTREIKDTHTYCTYCSFHINCTLIKQLAMCNRSTPQHCVMHYLERVKCTIDTKLHYAANVLPPHATLHAQLLLFDVVQRVRAIAVTPDKFAR